MHELSDFDKAVRDSRKSLEITGGLRRFFGNQLYGLVRLGEDDTPWPALFDKSENDAELFDDLLFAAKKMLRTAPEMITPAFGHWIADVLEKKRKRRVGRPGDVIRSKTIVLQIRLICDLYPSLKPMRNPEKAGAGPECSAEGGSACDAVGVAIKALRKDEANSFCTERGIDPDDCHLENVQYAAIETVWKQREKTLKRRRKI